MGSGFADTALAIFTTLAPMGAASFLVLAYAFFAGKVDEASVKRVDRLTAIPVALVLVGFLAACFHMASPLNAAGVFAGVGRSPLSNEVLAGAVFTVVMLAYWVVCLAGKMQAGLRKAFLAVLSVLAVVFAAFCGLAYMMNTIPTWNTPWTLVQMLGYALLGGGIAGALTLAAAKVDLRCGVGKATLAVSGVGLVLGVAGFGGMIATCAGLSNIWGCALDLVPAIWVLFALLAACGVAGVALLAVASRKNASLALLVVALLAVVVGVFFARIGFYGLFMSLAL